MNISLHLSLVAIVIWWFIDVFHNEIFGAVAGGKVVCFIEIQWICCWCWYQSDNDNDMLIEIGNDDYFPLFCRHGMEILSDLQGCINRYVHGNIVTDV